MTQTSSPIDVEQNSKSAPAPAAPSVPAGGADHPKPPLDPTRYGDWERNGRCIDF